VFNKIQQITQKPNLFSPKTLVHNTKGPGVFTIKRNGNREQKEKTKESGEKRGLEKQICIQRTEYHFLKRSGVAGQRPANFLMTEDPIGTHVRNNPKGKRKKDQKESAHKN